MSYLLAYVYDTNERPNVWGGRAKFKTLPQNFSPQVLSPTFQKKCVCFP